MAKGTRIDWQDYYLQIVNMMGEEIRTTAQIYGFVYEINKKVGSNSTAGSQAVKVLIDKLGDTLQSTDDTSIKVRGRQTPKLFEITSIEQAKAKIKEAFPSLEDRESLHTPKATKVTKIEDLIVADLKKKAVSEREKRLMGLSVMKPKESEGEHRLAKFIKDIKKDLVAGDVTVITYLTAARIKLEGKSAEINRINAYLDSFGVGKSNKEILEAANKSAFLQIVRSGEAINMKPGYSWKEVREAYYASLPLKKYYVRLCGMNESQVKDILKFVPVKVFSEIREDDNIYELTFHPEWRRELRRVLDLYIRMRGKDTFIGAPELVAQLESLRQKDLNVALNNDHQYEVEKMD